MPYKTKVRLQSFGKPKLTQEEILAIIPKDVLSEIKAKDEHPYFDAYSICHDGVSKPKLLEEGKHEAIQWPKSAVKSIGNVIKKGIKFFHKHNVDNSTDDRKELGEIVANTEKEIDGKLHSIAIGYFPPETREEVKKYDICSQESVWWYIKEAGKRVADKIEELTGIALSSSKEDEPAFQESGRLATVQCFESDGEPDNINGGEPKKDKIMTLNDVKDYIRENKVHIAQLDFTIEDVKADRVLGKVFDDLERKVEDLTKEKETYSKEKETYTKQIDEYVKRENLNTAKDRFSKIVVDMKLGDKEKKFIETRFGKETIEDFGDENLKKFVEDKREEFKQLAPIFSDTPIFEANKPTDQNQDADDMTKKENNELLDEDFNPYNN
jgi:hypothetical protein